MADITLVHDADVERRGDGSAPADLDGDFIDTWLDESSPNSVHGTAGGHKIGGAASSKGVPAARANGLYLYDLNYFLPADAAIVSAVWHIYVYDVDIVDSDMTFAVRRLQRADWVENEATWFGYKEPLDNGIAEGGGNDYLDDTNKAWTTDEWAGKKVHIYGGTGINQTRTVSSNTATRLTVSSNWSTNPDSTSWYVVGNLWGNPGGSTASPNIAIANPSIGWMARDITAMVTDAWSNRDGICTFNCLRSDNYDLLANGYFQHYTKNYRPTDATKPHHLRVTYTLAGKTFEAMIL